VVVSGRPSTRRETCGRTKASARLQSSVASVLLQEKEPTDLGWGCGGAKDGGGPGASYEEASVRRSEASHLGHVMLRAASTGRRHRTRLPHRRGGVHRQCEKEELVSAGCCHHRLSTGEPCRGLLMRLRTPLPVGWRAPDPLHYRGGRPGCRGWAPQCRTPSETQGRVHHVSSARATTARLALRGLR